YDFSATDLHLESGSTGHFRFPQGKRAIYRESLSDEQIRALLREIAPQRAWKLLESRGKASFVHEAPAGAVEVNLLRSEKGISATLRPVPPDHVAPEPTTASGVTFDPDTKTGQILSGDPSEAMHQLLRMMVEHGASDLHLVPLSPPIFRID